MNYIIEIKEFYSWLEYNDLSSTAISLWYALMNTANNAHWPEKISVPLSILMAKAGCNKDALYRARKQLKELGRIDFSEKRTGKATEYKILPFVSQEVSGNQPKNQTGSRKKDSQNQTENQKQNAKPVEEVSGKPTQNATQSAKQSAKPQEEYSRNVSGKPTRSQARSATQNANLYNNNNNNNISAAAEEPKKLGDVLRAFEENIGAISGAVISDIREFTEKGMEPELICAAINEAAISGAHSWKYVQAILRRCEEGGVRTAQQFAARQGDRSSPARQQSQQMQQESHLDFAAMEEYIRTH